MSHIRALRKDNYVVDAIPKDLFEADSYFYHSLTCAIIIGLIFLITVID